MSITTTNIYNRVLQISTVLLTFALVWFAFVFYPKVISNYKTGNFPNKPIIRPVSANSQKLPIETSAYRIEKGETSQAYYAFVEGKNLDEFVVNKNNAELAVKTALSLENLCHLDIIYASAQNLKVPPQFAGSSDCR